MHVLFVVAYVAFVWMLANFIAWSAVRHSLPYTKFNWRIFKGPAYVHWAYQKAKELSNG